MTPISSASAPRTLAPAGVQPSPHAARGIVLYIGLDEHKAAESGTNLTAVAEALQAYAHELASHAETQAIIALAPGGPERDLDAVRAVTSGSPAATGGAARSHGPVRSRIPARAYGVGQHVATTPAALGDPRQEPGSTGAAGTVEDDRQGERTRTRADQA